MLLKPIIVSLNVIYKCIITVSLNVNNSVLIIVS